MLLYLIFGILLVAPARADKVGINFIGGSEARGTPAPLKPAEIAGPFRQAFWNNAYEKSGTLLTPLGDDEKGSPASYTGFSVSWMASQTNTHPIALGTKRPDYRLGLGYLDAAKGQPVTITLSNIPAQFTTGGRSYSVVVYFTLDNIDFKNRTSGDKVNKFTLKGAEAGERTICGLQPSGTKPPLTGWVEVPEKSTTDEGANTPAGNYVIFSHLNDKEITLVAAGGFASDGEPRAAINAIQIIPNALRAPPTPEK